MRIRVVLRCYGEHAIPPRQELLFQIGIRLFQAANSGYAQALHQPILCGREPTLDADCAPESKRSATPARRGRSGSVVSRSGLSVLPAHRGSPSERSGTVRLYRCRTPAADRTVPNIPTAHACSPLLNHSSQSVHITGLSHRQSSRSDTAARRVLRASRDPMCPTGSVLHNVCGGAAAGAPARLCVYARATVSLLSSSAAGSLC